MMLGVIGFVVWYGDVVVVDGLSFSVVAGEIIGVIGELGLGKLSVVQVVMGLVSAIGLVCLCGGGLFCALGR